MVLRKSELLRVSPRFLFTPLPRPWQGLGPDGTTHIKSFVPLTASKSPSFMCCGGRKGGRTFICLHDAALALFPLAFGGSLDRIVGYFLRRVHPLQLPPDIRAMKFQQLETRDSELGSSKFQFFNRLSQLSRKFESGGGAISLIEERSRPTKPLRAFLLDLQGSIFLLSPSHEIAGHSKREKKNMW